MFEQGFGTRTQTMIVSREIGYNALPANMNIQQLLRHLKSGSGPVCQGKTRNKAFTNVCVVHSWSNGLFTLACCGLHVPQV